MRRCLTVVFDLSVTWGTCLADINIEGFYIQVMKYKLIIFDMDGTILDTLTDLADGVNYALARTGHELKSYEQVRGYLGNGIQKTIERSLPPGTDEHEQAKVLGFFREYYSIHCSDHTRAYKGINEELRLLKNLGYKLAVVSNKSDEAVKVLCKQYFDGIFDMSAGSRAGICKKPCPDSVIMVMQKLKGNCDAAIYVGDSEVDIQTAANAKIRCISVDWGFRDRSQLVEAGATVIISDPAQITELVR